MPAPHGFRVIFAAAAGPRIGFGHLVRCRSLARALGVAPRRGGARHGGDPPARRSRADGSSPTSARTTKTCAGWIRECSLSMIRPCGGEGLGAARATRRRARWRPFTTLRSRRLIRISSSTAACSRRAAIDGRFGSLRGPAYAILDPRVRATRERLTRPVPRRVLIALGGGRRSAVAARLARAIAARSGDVEIRVAGGFSAGRRMRGASRRPRGSTRKTASPRNCRRRRSPWSAGGVTLYEACALGVPVVAVALNAAQHVTIRAIARRGAAVDAGSVASGSGRRALASGFSRSTVASGVSRSSCLWLPASAGRRRSIVPRAKSSGSCAIRQPAAAWHSTAGGWSMRAAPPAWPRGSGNCPRRSRKDRPCRVVPARCSSTSTTRCIRSGDS